MATILVFVYYGSGLAVQAFTKPVFGIALVLFYYDQRIRNEGFDIEWMMQRAGLVAPVAMPAATGPAQQWMAPNGQAAVAVPASSLAVTDPDGRASEETQ
jgi:hypothetical protein